MVLDLVKEINAKITLNFSTIFKLYHSNGKTGSYFTIKKMLFHDSPFITLRKFSIKHFKMYVHSSDLMVAMQKIGATLGHARDWESPMKIRATKELLTTKQDTVVPPTGYCI